jgi:hypothetical protein
MAAQSRDRHLGGARARATGGRDDAVPAKRQLINLCANGEDNVAAGPDRARQQAAVAGVTINGVVLGQRDALANYLREHVQTGAGSFVIQVRGLGDVTDAILQKFLMEIAWLHVY